MTRRQQVLADRQQPMSNADFMQGIRNEQIAREQKEMANLATLSAQAKQQVKSPVGGGGTQLNANDYMSSLKIGDMDRYNELLSKKAFNPNDPAAKAVLANIMKNQGGQASPSLLPVVLASPNLSTAPLGSIASRDGGKTTAELIGQATAPQYNPNVDHASNVYNTQYGSYIDEVQLQGPGNSNNRYDGKYNPNDPRAYDPADIPVEKYIRNTLGGSTIDAIQAANAGVTDEGGFYPQGGSQIDMSNIIQPKQRTHTPANGYIQFMRNGGKQ